MCEMRALTSYKTSDELMIDINKCFIRCPGIGTLLKAQADCPILKQALERNLELLQKEDAKKKKAVLPPLRDVELPAVEAPKVVDEDKKELVFAGASSKGKKP